MEEMTAEQTLQVEILTGMMSYNDPVKGLCMNPFYNAPVHCIPENVEKARSIWAAMWQGFVSSYILSHLEERGIPKALLCAMDPDAIAGILTPADVPPDLTEFRF